MKKREIIALGSGFRLNFKYNKKKIKDLDLFILKVAYKYSWPVEGFIIWKKSFLESFEKNYLFHKEYFKTRYSIEELKNKSILAAVDKAKSHFAVIWKAFYKNLLLKEYRSNNSYKK